MPLELDDILARVAVRRPVNQQHDFVYIAVPTRNRLATPTHVPVHKRTAVALRGQGTRPPEHGVRDPQAVEARHTHDGEPPFAGGRPNGGDCFCLSEHDKPRIGTP